MLIKIGSINAKTVSTRDAYFKYTTLALEDSTNDFKALLPILQKSATGKSELLGKEDVSFGQDELELFEKLLKCEIEEVLSARKPEENKGGTEKIIFGRTVGLHLKGNHKDNILCSYITVYNIALDCLQKKKPMYITVTKQG